METIVEITGADEMSALASRLAEYLRPGDIICLTGGLGAGKTRFVQGLAAGLGIDNPVTSPTFAILKEYKGADLPLYHFDLYRLDTERELEDIGYSSYLFGEGVCAVEWGNKIPGIIPAGALTVDISATETEDRRVVSFTYTDVRWNSIAEAVTR
jgi:tRNA threonylcarbamoyladenosine biosynthesis protein TsaE